MRSRHQEHFRTEIVGNSLISRTAKAQAIIVIIVIIIIIVITVIIVIIVIICERLTIMLLNYLDSLRILTNYQWS